MKLLVVEDEEADMDSIKVRLSEELEKFRVIAARESLKTYLIEPSLVQPFWPDGPHNKEKVHFWCVCELPNLRILFAEDHGSGALGGSESLGLFQWVVSSNDLDDISGDDLWFRCLEDAFYQSGIWTGPLPEHYEVS